MPPIERICTVTGKKFLVSELEQELRKKFDVPLPDVHPMERMRLLMNFRNNATIYSDNCDLCGKWTMSVWGEKPSFPVYCHECWNADTWAPAELDLDLDRPFFDQLKELYAKTPRPARIVKSIEQSEYCTSASTIKNCYLCFNTTASEDCLYTYATFKLRDCVDVRFTMDAELLYDCVNCNQSYEVRWSEFAINCRNSSFLYDCVDCTDCTLSTGLRHKQYVFLNEQLTQAAYEERMHELKSGSYATLQKYKQQYVELKAQYKKKYMIGSGNEGVTGNVIFQSRNIERGFHIYASEDCANVFNFLNNGKDCLDVDVFSYDIELVYSSSGIGLQSSNVKYSWWCFVSATDLEYCALLQSSSHCFGSGFGRKLEYTILNKKYTEHEYQRLVSALKEKMRERGEYGQMFRSDLIPFAYNESIAQLNMPLAREEALARGLRWVDRNIPAVPPEQIYTPLDNINDVAWGDVDGKVLICSESKRPFKLQKAEFDFYKKYSIPLPRIHPDVRLQKRYPHDVFFNLHEAQCDACGAAVQTSMPNSDKVLCEACYQNAVV